MFGLFKSPSRKWCCSGFQGSYEEAGHRGFSVTIEEDDYLRARFLIRSRAVDQRPGAISYASSTNRVSRLDGDRDGYALLSVVRS